MPEAAVTIVHARGAVLLMRCRGRNNMVHAQIDFEPGSRSLPRRHPDPAPRPERMCADREQPADNKWDRSPNCAIRSGNWKALVNADGSGLELYDLSRSEVERESLADREPKRARELSERLLAWRRSLPVLGTAAG